MICPGVQVTLTGPHSLLAVIFGSQLGGVVGLHPRSEVPSVQLSKVGAVATCQVKVLVQVVGKTTSSGRVHKILSSVATIGYNLSWRTGHIDRTTLVAGRDVWDHSWGGVVGLHPRSVVPSVQLSKVGAVVTCQVKVLVQVVVRPQAVAEYTKS